MNVEAVQVHVASVAEGVTLGAAPAPAPRRKQRATILYTVVLTSDEPVKQILPPSPNRVIAYVQAGGNNAVLAGTKGDAQNKGNTGDTTLAYPVGCLLPFGNSAPYPLHGTDEVWAAAAAYPTQIAVSVTIETEA